MVDIITAEPSQEISIEDGTYDALVTGHSYTRQDVDKDDPSYDPFGPRLQLDFELDLRTEDGQPIMRRLRCNPRLKPRTNTWKYLEKILGQQIAVDDDIDLDELAGKPCRVNIESKASSTGNIWATIVAVYPAKRPPAQPEPSRPRVQARPPRPRVEDEEAAEDEGG